MIRFMLLVSRQGKVRLSKWYHPYDKKTQQAITREGTFFLSLPQLSSRPKLHLSVDLFLSSQLLTVLPAPPVCHFPCLLCSALISVCGKVLKRRSKMCNFIEWKDGKLVYKRYASLCFVAFVDNDDNELLHLETIHHFVEILDRYFGNVCELDLIFNFHRAYFILDELLLGGELQESSKKQVLKACATQDIMMSPSYAQDGKKHAELLEASLKRSGFMY